jgi:hypothetical protein
MTEHRAYWIGIDPASGPDRAAIWEINGDGQARVISKPPLKDGDRFTFGGMECVVNKAFCERVGLDVVFIPRGCQIDPSSEGGETD